MKSCLRLNLSIALALLLTPLLAFFAPSSQVIAADCRYSLGFKAVYDAIPSIVGDCLVNEHYNPENGDALQETSNGLMVWRKSDNFTAFTDGYRSWVMGPYGIQERLNTERFDWESGAVPAAPPAPPAPPTQGDMARVVRVIDGDTIEVEIAGQKKTVRYIGVNTPETVDPRRPVQAFGKEASAKNKELVEGQTVQLEKDLSEIDRYGRLLRYVYVGDLMINAELVRLGYAQASAYPPDVKYQDQFSELEREAREAGLGLWASATELPEAPVAAAPVAPPEIEANCDAAYPDFCIPPPPPDLDCKDIPRKRFKVLPPDPHRLDGNKDGIGCES